ncbi:MAG: HAD family hydrolase [Anaerolineae bacterium]
MPLITTHLKTKRHGNEPLVISDMEGTLSNGVTWKALGGWLKQNGQSFDYYRFYLPNLPRGLAYNMGWVADPQAFRESWIQGIYRLFAGFSTQKFEAVAEWVVENELWPKRNQAVVAELEAHLAAGRRVILISGLAEPILSKFAAKIGAESIGTRFEMFDGKLTGKVVLPFTTVHQKVIQVRYLVPNGKIYAAYGDSGADIFLLEISENPAAVSPDAELQAKAKEMDWRIV